MATPGHLINTLPDPASLNPDTPAKLAEIILRACAKQADARYANAEAMQEALAGFLQESGTE